MLKVQCPVCSADVKATISGGKLVIGQHSDERGCDCDGWGRILDLPTGTLLSADQTKDDEGLHGFRDY